MFHMQWRNLASSTKRLGKIHFIVRQSVMEKVRVLRKKLSSQLGLVFELYDVNH